MNTLDRNINEQLNLLVDEIIDNIIATSDEDIIKEVEEEYGNPTYEASRMRSIVSKSHEIVGQQRLIAARNELNKLYAKKNLPEIMEKPTGLSNQPLITGPSGLYYEGNKMTSKEFCKYLDVNNLKTKDVAIICGISTSAVNRYKSGARAVSRPVINCILYYLLSRQEQ